MPTATIDLPAAGYRFIPAVFQYSAGVAALPGFRIERVRFAEPIALAEGWRRIAALLEAAGRPRTAFCACELRSPAPFTEAGFVAFNRGCMLPCWAVGACCTRAGTRESLARSNVCPKLAPPAEPGFHAFCYTVPDGGGGAPPSSSPAAARPRKATRITATTSPRAAISRPPGCAPRHASCWARWSGAWRRWGRIGMLRRRCRRTPCTTRTPSWRRRSSPAAPCAARADVAVLSARRWSSWNSRWIAVACRSNGSSASRPDPGTGRGQGTAPFASAPCACPQQTPGRSRTNNSSAGFGIKGLRHAKRGSSQGSLLSPLFERANYP